MEMHDTDMWGRGQVRDRSDPSVWGKDTPGKDRILLCGGNVTLVCSGVYRMSVWSARHCIWKATDGQVGVQHGSRS